MPKRRKRKPREEIARNMSAIRSRENRTETLLRSALHRMGLRYRKYRTGLIGKPDIVFPRERLVVFVDGDYWHGRLLREKGLDALESYYTRQQQKYWVEKMQRNVARDEYVTQQLQYLGWEVIRFWESEIKENVVTIAETIAHTVLQRRAKAHQGTTETRDRGGTGYGC